MQRPFSLLALLLLPLWLVALPGSHVTHAQEPTPGGLIIGPSPTPTPTLGGLIIGPSPTPGGLVIGPSPTPGASPAPGVSGATYTSPTYGFSLKWDETWNVVEASSVGGEDRLQLSNGVSELTFHAHPGFGGDPATCLAGMVSALQSEPSVSEVGPAYGPDGQPLQGGDATQRFAVYTYQTESGGLPTASAAYLACRTLVPGNTVLEISHRTRLDAFNAESPKALAVLATVTVPAVGPTPVATATPAPTPGATVDCTGVDQWLAATQPRVDRLIALGKEAQGLTLLSPSQALGKLAQWAEELALLAQDQAATPAPPAAAQLNTDLANLFQTDADLLNQLIEALINADVATFQRVQQELVEADLQFNRLKARVDQLARDC